MTLAGIYRARCGAVTALVADYDVVTACGITCDRFWWCECGTRVSASVHGYVGPADVCEHLRTCGRTPAREARS